MSDPIRRSTPRSPRRRARTGAAGAVLLLVIAILAPAGALSAPGVLPTAPDVPHAAGGDDGPIVPTVHYEEYLAHADDDIEFDPGARVTVGFTPGEGDTQKVGGVSPVALPAGRLSGEDILEDSGVVGDAPATIEPSRPAPTRAPAPTAAPTPTAEPTTVETATPAPTARTEATATPLPLDQPIVEPGDAVPAVPAAFTSIAADDGTTGEPVDEVDLAAVVSPSGLRREVFGFLPYWELTDSSTVLDYAKLSTIAFFGVGAAANGTLEKTSGGAATVGWAGWTSSRLTTVINNAHKNNTRVVLTVQSFGWSTSGLNKQKSLLGSATARATLATQIATTVRDRGADGVNLDFEPLASGYESQFVDLVKRIRTAFNGIKAGYQITFDTTGSIGNYPIEAATAAGAADAIFIMGYDYRNGSTNDVGSIAPIGGPRYDILDTIRAYTARVPASKLILGVPWYGRAWSTPTDKLNAQNISSTANGASTTAVYSTAMGLLAENGRRYDSVEGVAWTAYKRDGVWRQLYIDDATALRAKYDLVNRYNLRGSGIWALGYDNGRTDTWTAIRDKFITDTTSPRAGVKPFAASQSAERFTVSWASADDFGVASHDVDVSIDGGAWRRWLSGATGASAPYVGARGHTFAFRVRARDGKGNLSAWTGQGESAAAALKVGGFGRVVTDTLNARSAAGTANSILATLSTGDIVAFLEGPKSANGYVWYRVAGPLTEWPVVGSARSDLWVAVDGSGGQYVAAVAPPNTTKVASTAALAASGGSEWFPVAPVRLLDTRTGNGLSGAFTSKSVRTVQVAGRGGVPADAIAITTNLTVTGATSNGYFSVGPTMTATPSTSSVNFKKGDTLANGQVIQLGSGGKLSAVFVGSSGARAHLVVDVTGYLRPNGSGASWYPLNPTRLLDTRTRNGLSGTFASRAVRTLQLAGRGSVPADAVAVTGNLTVTGSTGAGYVSIGPTMTSSPTTSTINFAKGQTVANNLTLRLGSGGKVGMVYVGPKGSSTHLVFDVTGYYRAGNGGAEWYPISQVRLLDTRTANALSGAIRTKQPQTFPPAGRGTVPVDAVAVTANLTTTGSTAAGYMSVGPTMNAAPTTSTINFAKGQTIANGVTLRLGSSGTAGVVFVGGSGSTTHAVMDLSGFFR